MLPKNSEDRKRVPLASGLFDYFPDALAAVAEVSFVGNEKHNPGQPLHWSREKSNDHADCLLRHLMERGRLDVQVANGRTYTVRHSAEMAWRALAILQLELEAASPTPPPAGFHKDRCLLCHEPFEGSGDSRYGTPTGDMHAKCWREM